VPPRRARACRAAPRRAARPRASSARTSWRSSTRSSSFGVLTPCSATGATRCSHHPSSQRRDRWARSCGRRTRLDRLAVAPTATVARRRPEGSGRGGAGGRPVRLAPGDQVVADGRSWR
jgi:hypothetical protein